MAKKGMKKKGKVKGKTLSSAQVKEVKKIVKKEEKAEIKHSDEGIGFTGFSSSAGSALTNITGSIPQGLLDSNRVGDQIVLKAVEVKYTVQNSTGNTSNIYNVARIIIFQYMSEDMTPTYTNLLLNDQGGTRTAFSPYNPDYQHQYIILYDKMHTTVGNLLATEPLPSNYAITKHFKLNIKYAHKKIQFQSGSPTNCTGGIWMLTIGYFPTIASNPVICMQSRTYYQDS